MLSDRSRPVIEGTLPVVAENIEEIARRFYAHLFEAHPELLDGVFNRGNQAEGSQPVALAGSVAVFASALVRTPEQSPDHLLSRIAHKHASLGITPAHSATLVDSHSRKLPPAFPNTPAAAATPSFHGGDAVIAGQFPEMGDRAWRQLIDRHFQMAEAEVHRWLGQHIENTGDGIMATFDTPTRALRCAFALHGVVRGLGLEMRAAVHTGEIERREGGWGGIGVHIAARVLGRAAADQVVVTRTVRDLATGNDLVFEPMGSVTLRGVPGEWELFQAAIG